MEEAMRKSFSLKHLRQHCKGCPDLPDDTVLAPLFEIIWKDVLEKELVARKFEQFGITDAFFLEREGHLKRGLWMCVVDGLLVRLMPVSTDMDVVSAGRVIHMVWRIEAEGDEKRVSALIIKVAAFIKKYMAGKDFKAFCEEGANMLRKYPPAALSKHVRRFYNLGG